MSDQIMALIVGAIISLIIFFVVMIAGAASRVDGTITLILACASAFGTLAVTVRIILGRD